MVLYTADYHVKCPLNHTLTNRQISTVAQERRKQILGGQAQA